MAAPKLCIVLPCYNEEEVLPLSIPQLMQLLNDMIARKMVASDSFLCFVNDGSRDKTWDILKGHADQSPQVRAIKFSRNFGHQSAILAGMLQFREEVDCVVTIDVDLQDDVSVIERMVADYNQGSQIVYGIREKRDADSFFKRSTALLFYRIMRIMGIDSIHNHADFRLVGSQALATLANYQESNLYLRGLFPQLGFQTSMQYYDRKSREAGETKYTFKKMFSLAWNGITSFSILPLKLVTVSGVLIIGLSFLLGIWALYTKFTGETVPGWTSIVVPIYFIGGIQMLFLGIIGEYIGKIYMETKRRPQYIIDQVVK